MVLKVERRRSRERHAAACSRRSRAAATVRVLRTGSGRGAPGRARRARPFAGRPVAHRRRRRGHAPACGGHRANVAGAVPCDVPTVGEWGRSFTSYRASGDRQIPSAGLAAAAGLCAACGHAAADAPAARRSASRQRPVRRRPRMARHRPRKASWASWSSSWARRCAIRGMRPRCLPIPERFAGAWRSAEALDLDESRLRDGRSRRPSLRPSGPSRMKGAWTRGPA